MMALPVKSEDMMGLRRLWNCGWSIMWDVKDVILCTHRIAVSKSVNAQ